MRVIYFEPYKLVNIVNKNKIPSKLYLDMVKFIDTKRWGQLEKWNHVHRKLNHFTYPNKYVSVIGKFYNYPSWNIPQSQMTR